MRLCGAPKCLHGSCWGDVWDIRHRALAAPANSFFWPVLHCARVTYAFARGAPTTHHGSVRSRWALRFARAAARRSLRVSARHARSLLVPRRGASGRLPGRVDARAATANEASHEHPSCVPPPRFYSNKKAPPTTAAKIAWSCSFAVAASPPQTHPTRPNRTATCVRHCTAPPRAPNAPPAPKHTYGRTSY